MAPTASSAIAKVAIQPTEDGDGTQEPVKERCSVPSKCTLWGAWRRGLAEAVPVPKDGACRDAGSALPNWAAIAASPGKTTLRSLAGQERLEPSVERGPLCQRVAASLRQWIVGSHLCASPGREFNKD